MERFQGSDEIKVTELRPTTEQPSAAVISSHGSGRSPARTGGASIAGGRSLELQEEGDGRDDYDLTA